MDKIWKINFYDLEVETILWVYDDEKIKKKFYMDIEISFDLWTSFLTDRLVDTVDTWTISKMIREFLLNKNYDLLETLAYEVHELLLSTEKIKSAEVTIYKEVYSNIRKVGFTFSW